MAGAGGIRSSVYDMLIFLKANMEMMQHPLQEAMRLTHEPRHNKAGKNRVGLGWHIQDGKNGDILWHNGSTGGYSSFTGFTKESGRGVVVMTNSTQGVDDIGFHLLDSSRPLENVVPHIATKLKAIIDAEGASNLMIKYDRLKKENAENFDFSETGINALGYYYLNRKRFEEAIAVFMLNISEYPGSSNVYDSYAEALMESGQTALAIENYKKSLDINPGNTNAVSMLAKMGVEIELPAVKVDESILESYTGTYELAPGFNIVITREGGKLMAQATGQDAYEIFAINNTRFYYKVVDAQIVFNKDKSGVTDSLTLYQGGREISGRKK